MLRTKSSSHVEIPMPIQSHRFGDFPVGAVELDLGAFTGYFQDDVFATPGTSSNRLRILWMGLHGLDPWAAKSQGQHNNRRLNQFRRIHPQQIPHKATFLLSQLAPVQRLDPDPRENPLPRVLTYKMKQFAS